VNDLKNFGPGGVNDFEKVSSEGVNVSENRHSELFGGVGWYEEGYRGPHGEGPHVHVDIREGDSTAIWGFDSGGNEYHGAIPSFGTCP
jgi:hypothetical protein